MTETVVCIHPREHGVTNHVVGSYAARECYSWSSTETHPVFPVPHPAVPQQQSLSRLITHYEMKIKLIDTNTYEITTTYQVSADNEDDAYAIAESTYPNFEGSGISAIHIEDDEWDVATRITVHASTTDNARAYASSQFTGQPHWSPSLEIVE